MSEFTEEDIEWSKKRYEEESNKFLRDLFFLNRGRIARLSYFMIIMTLSFPKKWIAQIEDYYELFPFLTPITLIFDYITISLLAKRFRDIGVSGWFALPIGIINFIAYIYLFAVNDQELSFDAQYIPTALGILLLFNLPLFLWPSQKRDNKYGSYPAFSLGKGIQVKKKP